MWLRLSVQSTAKMSNPLLRICNPSPSAVTYFTSSACNNGSIIVRQIRRLLALYANTNVQTKTFTGFTSSPFQTRLSKYAHSVHVTPILKIMMCFNSHIVRFVKGATCKCEKVGGTANCRYWCLGFSSITH